MKVAVVFNEIDPHSYQKKEKKERLDFIPYFEIEDNHPFYEYEKIVNSLKKSGYDAYLLNIKDNLNLFLEDLEKNNLM